MNGFVRVAVALAAFCAGSQAAAEAKEPDDEAVAIRMKRVDVTAATDQGHYGSVVIAVDVFADATVHNARIKESSRSPMLDAAALEMGNSATAIINPKQNNRKFPITRQIELPFGNIMLSSSLITRKSHSCAKFVSRANWTKRTWPEDNYRTKLVEYQVELIPILAKFGGDLAQMLALAKLQKLTIAAMDETLRLCEALPPEQQASSPMLLVFKAEQERLLQTQQ